MTKIHALLFVTALLAAFVVGEFCGRVSKVRIFPAAQPKVQGVRTALSASEAAAPWRDLLPEELYREEVDGMLYAGSFKGYNYALSSFRTDTFDAIFLRLAGGEKTTFSACVNPLKNGCAATLSRDENGGTTGIFAAPGGGKFGVIVNNLMATDEDGDLILDTLVDLSRPTVRYILQNGEWVAQP